MRVLRYLPTNLTAPEIARELYISPNTVKAHMRNLYVKFGTHSRADTVDRARALGLLAPSPLKGQLFADAERTSTRETGTRPKSSGIR
jgi:LuxR family maltose regulon positive regulatory protein